MIKWTVSIRIVLGPIVKWFKVTLSKKDFDKTFERVSPAEEYELGKAIQAHAESRQPVQ